MYLGLLPFKYKIILYFVINYRNLEFYNKYKMNAPENFELFNIPEGKKKYQNNYL
jgi:hypothetical protein